MDQHGSIPLTVVVSTNIPWPHVKPCLESLVDQTRAAGGEIILADGSGEALAQPPDPAFGEFIWLKMPPASSFTLRAQAIVQARGEIIAITEDHCRVHPDWCERILQAHTEYPEAAAIGGSVENGARDRLVDWATFFIANGPFMRPMRNGESQRIAAQANISYKRRVLLDEQPPDLGLMEMTYNEMLRA